MSPRLRRGPGPRALRVPPLLAEALRDGAVALEPTAVDPARMRVAIVIPQFRRGGGGHKTIADLVRGLEARGHQLQVLLVDDEDLHADSRDAELSAQFSEFFGPTQASVRRLAPGEFEGADVVLATGWQTVPAAMRLPGVGARAYLVQDHEPEFYATSAEREWAAWTYRQGLHAICASPWLAKLVGSTYGATTSSFDLGVDHDVYRALPHHRRGDTVLFYARAATPRRAVPLGALALAELRRRRPDTQVWLFGESRELATPFEHRHLGVLPPAELADAYATATAGLVLSLTNPSLVPTEMLACGLPVVDLDVPSMRDTFGSDGPVVLAAPEPSAIADALERLLDDLAERADRTLRGMELVAERTWARAAAQVEAGLRTALDH